MHTASLRPWALARTFLLIFVSFSVLLLGIASVHYYTSYQAERVHREASERVNVALARRALLSDISTVVTDLMVLVRYLEVVLDESDVLSHDGLGRIFTIFISEKRLYDQIRYIDVAGREQVRVNLGLGHPEPVTGAGLQDKSARYYFRETNRLPRGGIYLSPLDLNVEQGLIEHPLKPMLRLAAPVFDDGGRRRGMVVLNYLGQRLLDNFREAAAHVTDHIHLVDNQGYWLSSPRSGDAWGFMLGHERRFDRSFATEWQRIVTDGEGQFMSDAGLFTFSVLSPISAAESMLRAENDLAASNLGRHNTDYAWMIVSHLGSGDLVGTPARFFTENAVLYLCLLALLALGSWMLARSRVHHRLAEAQGEYERRFRRTLEDIELAAVTMDRHGRLSFCNNYFLDLTGWAKGDVVGEDWAARFVPEDETASMRGLLRRLPEPERFPKRFESHLLTRDGGRRLISWHSTLSLDPLGDVVSLTAIGEDITEKRRTEQEWFKLHRAVEQSPSIVLITDRKGCIEYVNPKFTEVTGYPPEEVMGRNPRLLKSGETRAEDYAELWRTITSGGVWYGEFHNRRKNGELYWEAAAISAMRDPGGAIINFLAVKEDITERKRLENEVEQRNRELARTQALTQMGRMASMIAHDLRNPLSSVKMTLQVLGKQARNLSAESAELTRISLEQVAYMEAILNDMLTYSRPQELRSDWLSAQKLMEAVVGLTQRKLDELGVSVRLDCRPGLPTFPGDANQLRQVFSNLLINAAQAMEAVPGPDRVLDIRVDLEMAEQGTSICIDIEDRGEGIDPEEQERLFEPFYTTRAKGTGLGLAIVRQILERHGGRIHLSRRPERGTWVRVLLPTVPVEQESEAQEAALH